LSIRIVDEEPAAALEKLTAAVRDARMLGALLYIQGADIFLDRDGALLPACFNRLRLLDDACLISSRAPFKFQPDMPGNDYPLMVIPFESLSAAERAELWQVMLEDVTNDSITEADLRALSGQFSLSSGQIVAAASSAMSRAVQ
ncbi:MAG: hypothetical protein CUN53_20390, partial [Phototrophicales bacterium]